MKSVTVRGHNGGAVTLLEDSGDKYGDHYECLTVIAVSDALAPTASWLSLDYYSAKQLMHALADFVHEHPWAPKIKDGES